MTALFTLVEGGGARDSGLCGSGIHHFLHQCHLVTALFADINIAALDILKARETSLGLGNLAWVGDEAEGGEGWCDLG